MRALLVLALVVAAALAGPPRGAAAQAGLVEVTHGAGLGAGLEIDTGGGDGAGSVWRWAEQYLRPFSDGIMPPRTDERLRLPSCGGGDCPSGSQCCCCGDRCYCKKECSLQPCGPAPR